MVASGKLSDEGNDLALSLLFHIGSPSIPSAVYVGLTTVVPTETSTLSTITEVTESGYARQALALTTPGNSGGKRETHNSAQIEFGAFATGGTAVVGGFVTDAASGTSGKILAVFDLGTTKTTNAGEKFYITTASPLSISND